MNLKTSQYQKTFDAISDDISKYDSKYCVMKCVDILKIRVIQGPNIF